MNARFRYSRWVLGPVVAALTLTGCVEIGGGKDSTSGADGARHGAASGPDPEAPTVQQVAKPWQPGMPELGVNVYWEDSKDDDEDVTLAKSERLLDHLVTLNANSVALNIPFVMDGLTSNAVKPHKQYTPSPERVRIFLDAAAERKFRVTLRPLLDERTLLPKWRGEIAPASRDKWFASYQSFLLPYVRQAAESSTAELVIGVELNSLQRDSRWKSLITTVRKSYRGKVTYSENFDAFRRDLATPPVDAVGVDAYFGIKVPDSASVDRLAKGWGDWIDKYAGSGADDLVLHEVGIAAQKGAYHHPAQWGSTGVPINLTVQRNWYEAVCRTVEEKGLAGVYFWYIRMHHDPGNEDPNQDDRITFVDRPAEKTMQECYARLAG